MYLKSLLKRQCWVGFIEMSLISKECTVKSFGILDGTRHLPIPPSGQKCLPVQLVVVDAHLGWQNLASGGGNYTFLFWETVSIE